jgi:2-hydroxycyclohexanecarboxyl-CoA dehydrogenase
VSRVVVITGAGRGIGRAIALRVAGAGFAVAVWDLDETNATGVAGEITMSGGRALGIRCDVGDRASVARAAATTRERLGAPWGLVNNAGVDRMSLFKDSNPDDWELILRVNFFGMLNCTKALLDDMVATGAGRIVCISSDAGRVGSSGEAVYSGSKAAVLGFMKALAREVARHGVTVNAVCPGPTDTELLDAVRRGPKGDRIVEGMIKAVPLGRVAQPADIAGTIVFFLSEDAGYITGQTLSVSGGLTMA